METVAEYIRQRRSEAGYNERIVINAISECFQSYVKRPEKKWTGFIQELEFVNFCGEMDSMINYAGILNRCIDEIIKVMPVVRDRVNKVKNQNWFNMTEDTIKEQIFNTSYYLKTNCDLTEEQEEKMEGKLEGLQEALMILRVASKYLEQ